MLRNTKEERGLQNVFYIVECDIHSDQEWWQLRLIEGHFVMSAVESKEKVLECLYKICRRYKNYKGLMKALKHCENKESISTLERSRQEYAEVGQIYAEDVQEVVIRALQDTTKTPKRTPKKTLMAPPLPVVEQKTIEISTKEVTFTKKMPKKKLGLIRTED